MKRRQVVGLVVASALLAAGVVAASETGLVRALIPPTPAERGDSEQTRIAQAAKVVFHVDQNDPAVMNLALNNAQNVASHYKAAGLAVTIEVVAYGPGLHMLRADTSPIKPRLASFILEQPEIRFSACGNTHINMAKAEGKPVPLMTEAKVVPSGVVRLIELQQQGYAYIKP